MKNLIILSLSALAFTQPALAKLEKQARPVYQEQTQVSSYAPEYITGPSGSGGFGLGVASASNVTRTFTALSTYHIFGRPHAVQTYFGISQTDPFDFGIGANYKYSIVEGSSAAFHIGAGVGLGKNAVGGASPFFFHVNGILGLHFQIPSVKEILFSFDFGPSLQILDGDVDFQIEGLSSLIGVSVHYLF